MIRTRSKKAQAQETTAPDVYPTEAAAEEHSDHGLHVSDQACALCGRDIKPTDEARKTLKGECVHISC